MRDDMKKVVTERARTGGDYTYHTVRARLNQLEPDDSPLLGKMRQPYGWGRKEFSDVLGPLRGYLRSCIGRRWDDVWSEICAQLSNNTVDRHLKEHVRSDVTVNAVLLNGVLYERSRYFGLSPVGGMYVDPHTGMLCDKPYTQRKYAPVTWQDNMAYEKDATNGVLCPITRRGCGVTSPYARKIFGSEQEAVQMDGIWYRVMFATVPPILTTSSGRIPVNFSHTDIVTLKPVKAGDRYRAAKQQMASRELRRHGLRNT